MTPKSVLAVIDRLYKDIEVDTTLKNIPFAVKVILMSGNFRQTLPEVPHGRRASTFEASIKSHPFWNYVVKPKLTKIGVLQKGKTNSLRIF